MRKPTPVIDMECSGGDPLTVGFGMGQGIGLKGQPRSTEHEDEGPERRKEGNSGDDCFGQPATEKAVQEKACKRQQRDQPEMEIIVHSFIRSIRSTASVARARKTAMMMASPTAASAAATIMTKKTKIWPFT